MIVFFFLFISLGSCSFLLHSTWACSTCKYKWFLLSSDKEAFLNTYKGILKSFKGSPTGPKWQKWWKREPSVASVSSAPRVLHSTAGLHSLHGPSYRFPSHILAWTFTVWRTYGLSFLRFKGRCLYSVTSGQHWSCWEGVQRRWSVTRQSQTAVITLKSLKCANKNKSLIILHHHDSY